MAVYIQSFSQAVEQIDNQQRTTRESKLDSDQRTATQCIRLISRMHTARRTTELVRPVVLCRSTALLARCG